MKNKRSLTTLLSILLGLVLLGASAGGTSAQLPAADPPGTGAPDGMMSEAQEAQAAMLAPAAGGPGIFHAWGIAFVPYVPSDSFGRAGVGIYNTGGGPINFETQLHLPHGATIQKVVVYFYDNDPTYNLRAWFNWHPLNDWFTYTFEEVSSSGASTATVRYVEAAPTHPMTHVDGTAREYAVEVQLPPTMNVVLLAVRVDYGFSAALPAVMK